ncbi:hypothetical protein [Achromobacter sp.]|uniref:hypothetical protein n=1 Tax=Achromobacter sp. TaxID=134375 RepID=UPI0025794938|nr:hypothetical protein [Achromobacter sp.]
MENTIAATPQLGAVHPNVIMRLMQALMRILRMLFERLGLHDRSKDSEDAEGDRQPGQEPTGGIRFRSAEASGAGPSAQVQAPVHAQPSAADQEASKLKAEAARKTGHGMKTSVMPAMSDSEDAPETPSDATTADVVAAAMVRLAEDPQVRHRMDGVGPNSNLQTAVFMAAFVDSLRSRARVVQDSLAAYGGALNLRLARHQGQCTVFGGHTAAALLLQNGVIQPRDISAVFADEVKDITGRHQPHLDELNQLRAAMAEAAREVYRCAADTPLQEQLLNEMDSSLTDLLGKDWRKSLALERMGSAPDEDEIAAEVHRMGESDRGDEAPIKHFDDADRRDGDIASEADRAAPTGEAEADHPHGHAADEPPQGISSAPTAAVATPERDTVVTADEGAAGSPSVEPETLPITTPSAVNESSSGAMSRDEAMAQFALLDAGAAHSGDEAEPAESARDYARERG